MKAIIMAGGEGTRLRPLTCDMPKPMMRLMDKPIIEYSLELLSLYGVTEAAVTLGYLPERIRDYLGDEKHGVKIKYYTEQHPLGTAGGVKQAQDFLDETFCVLSGDGVTDCDLKAALDFHRRQNSLATMVLKRLSDPTPYGLVLTTPEGRVTRFVEKPIWGEVVSDTVNTGVYILEPEIFDMIPDGEYDFGSQLFPLLAEKGLLYGYITDRYWCDIGDIPAYLSTCRDALDGRINLPSLASGIFISEDTNIHETAHIESPCYIGHGARIGKNARIGAYSVISSGAVIGERADIKRSVIWPGARLDEGVQARSCVIGRESHISACARIYENCAIGTGAVIGTDSEIAPGVCIWPGKRVGEAILADTNLIWGDTSAACFHKGALSVASPSDALRAAQAFAAALRPREVLLGRSPSAAAAAAWHSCAAGLMAQGVRVMDAGICTLPQLRYAMALMQTECGLMVRGNTVLPLENGGAMLSKMHQRSVCALISRQDYPPPFTAEPQPISSIGRSDQAYIAMLASAFCSDPEHASPAAVHCSDPMILDIAERVFQRAGLRGRFEWEDELMELFPGEIGIWLSADGASARFSHAGGMLTDPQSELISSWAALERGERTLIISEHATRAIDQLANNSCARLLRVPRGPVLENELISYASQFRLHTDGIYLAICVLSALTENALTLSGWLSTMPKVHRAAKSIPLPDDRRGRILRRYTETAYKDIDIPGGYTWISPSDTRPECTVYAEAYDMETASELCDICLSKLAQAAEENTNA
ncbi:MAG: NTP transferase domain-containing protein [Clostridia bacterium]|nr:NTP transferase domain-containing protein [Clostridia bacterium]